MDKHIRYAVVILSAVISMLLGSCGNEEPAYNATNEKLKGTTWHYYKRVENGKTRELKDYYGAAPNFRG